MNRRGKSRSSTNTLLSTWPRLVRWQTQDADAAQLRDELRQAARLWDDHHRSSDFLWAGKAYREYSVWRENYLGRLTELEDDFSHAMTAFARRRKRRRRIVGSAGVAALLAVLTVVTVLWQRSVRETHRAEAAKLLALGELALDTYPTASLAWAVSSLELTDTFEGRMLALRALAEGPPLTVLPLDIIGGFGSFEIALSPQGTWLATGDQKTALFPHAGGEPKVLGPPLDSHTRFRRLFLSEYILLTENAGVRRWWSVPDPLEPIRVEELPGFPYAVQGDNYLTYRFADGQVIVVRWQLAGGAPERVGSTERWNSRDISSDGSTIAYSQGREVFLGSTGLGGRRAQDRGGCILGFAIPPSTRAAVRSQRWMPNVWSGCGPRRTAHRGTCPRPYLSTVFVSGQAAISLPEAASPPPCWHLNSGTSTRPPERCR